MSAANPPARAYRVTPFTAEIRPAIDITKINRLLADWWRTRDPPEARARQVKLLDINLLIFATTRQLPSTPAPVLGRRDHSGTETVALPCIP